MNPATAPPGSPSPSSTPKPGASKRPRRAAALSDVTNLLPDTRIPTKTRRTGERRPAQQQPFDASASASTCSSSASVTPAPKHSSSVTPAPKRSSAAAEDLDGVFPSPAISTVYARRGATGAEGTGRRTRRGAHTTTNKGKSKEPAAAAAAGAASCPQLGKSKGKSSVAHDTQDTRPISSSAPCAKKRPSSSTPKLPDDFVKKQRAYFADIDAFELAEEEVSETDLD